MRIRRQETSIPVSKHGLKLYRSFEQGSWLMQVAERVPEESLYKEEAWELILTEILTNLKPYLDIQTEVLIERMLFTGDRSGKETMSAFLTRHSNLKREF